MTRLQKLLLRQSEIRERLNELLEVEERSEEQTGELRTLTTEGRELEPEIRAAMVAEPEPETRTEPNTGDAEEREREELRSAFSVGRVIAGVMDGRAVDGREAEYQTDRGVGGSQIPLDVFERRDDPADRETRAVTPAPGTVGRAQRPILPALFDRSIAPFLGISMPSAGVGDQAFPVLTTSVTAEPEAKGADADESAGAFTVGTAQPRRVTGSFRFQVEDAARLRGLEQALRSNLSMVLSDAVDNQALNGSGSGDGTLNGLLNILADPSAPASGEETFDRYVEAFAAAIDGLHAVDESGVKALVGVETYRHMAKLYRAGVSASETVSKFMGAQFGGVRASRRIAAPASDIQQAVIARRNPAGDSAAVMPAWDSMTIRDIYSGAGKGEVVVTAYALVGDVVLLRTGCFIQDSFRLA